MMINPNDDSRLTAYVLGEIDPSERERVETLLKESEEARRTVEEIRLTVRWLTRELHHEQETYSWQPLPNHQPLELRGTALRPSPAPKSWWSHKAFKLGSLAAGLLLTAGLTRLAIMPRGNSAAGPSPVADAKPRMGAEEIVSQAVARARAVPATRDDEREPKLVMTLARNEKRADLSLLSELGVARDSVVPHTIRRKSVIQGSADVELALASPSGHKSKALVPTSLASEGQYYKLNTPERVTAQFDAAQNQQANQAFRGMAGGMSNTRGVQQGGPPVSGPHAASQMMAAHEVERAALGRRLSQSAEPRGAAAGAPVSALSRDRSSPSGSLAAKPAADGARAPQKANEVPPASADVSDKVQAPAQIPHLAKAIPQSRAKNTITFESQPAESLGDSPFRPVRESPQATFLLDVDRASYANIRCSLNRNTLPSKDDVRGEELLNAFPYHDLAPSGSSSDPFSIHVEIGGCPWDQRHRLARIGITGQPIERADRPSCNLVLLLDVSASMQQPDRLPLIQWSLNRLIDQLGERDRLAIVAFGQTPGVVLSPSSGLAKAKIRATVDELRVEAADATRSGLALAYEIAGQSFQQNATNRVLLVTDDRSKITDLGANDLIGLVAARASSGVSLSVLAVGAGNAQDHAIVTLAEKGQGHYARIGSPLEAYRVLVEEMGSKLATIATNAKVSVEFNSGRVSAYRSIGYEGVNVRPNASIDDARDAGAIVAGHHVSALYEVVPAADLNLAQRPSRVLRETRSQFPETLTVRLSYNRPDDGQSRLIEKTAFDPGASFDRASNDLKLAAAAAAFGMLLRDSPFPGSSSFDGVHAIIQPFLTEENDRSGYFREFDGLIGKAKILSAGSR
jgi:Ca-activated chloride channel family protein